MQLPLIRRPIAIQADENIARYEATYRILEQEGTGLPGALGPYHYASHYSNTGIVLHLLVRLLPFTREFIKFQAVLRIRIRIILGLLDPDPLVRGIDPDLDPFIIKLK